MACYHPASAVRLQNGDVKFVSGSTVDGSLMKLPCGQCVGCRLERSRQWAIRCMDEAQMHKENCFITLTFTKENVQKLGRSLDVSVFQKFMKRVRKEVAPKRVRFFHCGEYTKAFVPHYHALLFGLDFKDRKYWSMNGAGTHKLYRSETLERLWPFGFSWIGDVSFESAAYVARYVLKKVNGTRDDEQRLVMMDTGEVLKEEYLTMSRRPGIGTAWYKKFKSDVYPLGSRVVRGRDMRPPRFYDNLFKIDSPNEFEDLQYERIKSFDINDNTMQRLAVKEEVTNARVRLLRRSLEEI